jgi:hypothetical protein
MCKEVPVIPINRVADKKRLIGKKWRIEEEKRHKGSLTPPPSKKEQQLISGPRVFHSPRYVCTRLFATLKWITREEIHFVLQPRSLLHAVTKRS